jgi:hypothetical protein
MKVERKEGTKHPIRIKLTEQEALHIQAVINYHDSVGDCLRAEFSKSSAVESVHDTASQLWEHLDELGVPSNA